MYPQLSDITTAAAHSLISFVSHSWAEHRCNLPRGASRSASPWYAANRCLASCCHLSLSLSTNLYTRLHLFCLRSYLSHSLVSYAAHTLPLHERWVSLLPRLPSVHTQKLIDNRVSLHLLAWLSVDLSLSLYMCDCLSVLAYLPASPFIDLHLCGNLSQSVSLIGVPFPIPSRGEVPCYLLFYSPLPLFFLGCSLCLSFYRHVSICVSAFACLWC